MNGLCLLGPGSPEHNLEKRDDGPGGAGVVCLVEESGHRAAKQRSNPVDPVTGEVAKDSSWTEAVGWFISRLVYWLIISSLYLRAGFILDPVKGTAKRWQAATVRPKEK